MEGKDTKKEASIDWSILMRITHERLLTEIKNTKKVVDRIEGNDKEQWTQINTNRENIASHKSIIRIMEVFIVGIISSIIAYFWKGQS